MEKTIHMSTGNLGHSFLIPQDSRCSKFKEGDCAVYDWPQVTCYGCKEQMPRDFKICYRAHSKLIRGSDWITTACDRHYEACGSRESFDWEQVNCPECLKNKDNLPENPFEECLRCIDCEDWDEEGNWCISSTHANESDPACGRFEPKR